MIHCEVTAVFTNTTPVDAYRGAGRPEATYVVERLVETAAREMKIDPAEIRRRNFITAFPYQTPVALMYDIGDYNATMDAAQKLGGCVRFCLEEKSLRSERQAARPRLRRLHRGLRHRALGGRRRRSARAQACSKRAKCACIRPAA